MFSRAQRTRIQLSGVFVLWVVRGMLFITARTTVPWLPGFSRHIWRPGPGCYSWSGPGIFGPPYTTITTYHPITGAPAEFRSQLPRSASVYAGRENGIVSDKWIGEHWHWLYESHLRATMQLQLISFALIILHCMDYTGCQQHSSSRHWQHKREYHQCRTKHPEFSCTRGIFTFKFTNLDPQYCNGEVK